MKVIIAGSRNINSYNTLLIAIAQAQFKITEVISGGARGVDTLGEKYAKENNIPCTVMLANWNEYGKSAGYIRNQQMADRADALIAIWDGKSKGTKHIIDLATLRGLHVSVYRVAIIENR